MKLVPKLTAALVAVTCAVLAANGYLRVRREVAVLHADRVQDQAMLSRSLGAAVTAVWRSDGRTDALRVVEDANAHGGSVHARLLDGAPGPGEVHADPAALLALAAGESVTRIAATKAGDERFTYAPIFEGSTRVALLELSEPLAAERAAVSRILADTVRTTLALIFVSGGLSMILGYWLVGAPVRALCGKAQRIGAGDFASPLLLASRDEFADVAGEMNAMCGKLTAAQSRLEEEASARIAALEQLRHADRLMTVGKLASGIAHELGTPLNVISIRASMIASGDTSSAETTEYATIIADASKRMAKIIRQLLAFARRNPADKSPRDVRQLARDTLELLRPLAEKNDIRLELCCDDEETQARVDGGELQQALTNLVVNAIQAMPSGGRVELSIAREVLSPSGERPSLRVTVRDEGPGISAEDLPHVFEPFFTTKDVGEGTGLGLSVTHGIIEDHGGRIAVESAPGRGTSFTIHLPIGELT